MDGVGQLRVVSAEQARSCFAELIVPRVERPRIGRILLHEHQANAVRLLKSALARFGGALLCDRVGTGKTFTALAVAAGYSRTVVVAPAVLRSMWVDAAHAAGATVEFISHEALSRNTGTPIGAALLIVDEAHHARNPLTKRFRALSRLAHGTDVLLLTATPIHNRPQDVATVLSLFLGQRANGLSPVERATLVIRRDDVVVASKGIAIPPVAEPHWVEIENDDSIVEAIAGLPPPLPLRDGSGARPLIVHALVRQWASSDAALRGGLRRRSLRGTALIAALESGTYPSRAELSAWATGDDAVQLAFPELVAAPLATARDLLPVIRAHARDVDRLLHALGCDSTRDASRAEILMDIRRKHQGIPIVAFSQFEDTVSAMFRLLAGDGGVAALSGRSGRVAGGTITRREVIERFAPRASGRPPPSASEVVSLLLTTDILSEGVNLQDAGVIVHLDLPFTHARLEQRTGRIARLGSPHDSISAYLFRPPATAETVARIERLLDIKFSFAQTATSSAHTGELIRRRLSKWRSSPCGPGVVSAVASRTAGFLAAVRIAGCVRLLGSIDGRITDEPEIMLKAIQAADGVDKNCAMEDVVRTIRDIEHHIAGIQSLGRGGGDRVRRRILRRINFAVNRSRCHTRSRVASLAQRARQAVTAPGDAYADLRLTVLADSDMPDEDWLQALCAHDLRRTHSSADGPADILALLLFIPGER